LPVGWPPRIASVLVIAAVFAALEASGCGSGDSGSKSGPDLVRRPTHEEKRLITRGVYQQKPQPHSWYTIKIRVSSHNDHWAAARIRPTPPHRRVGRPLLAIRRGAGHHWHFDSRPCLASESIQYDLHFDCYMNYPSASRPPTPEETRPIRRAVQEHKPQPPDTYGVKIRISSHDDHWAAAQIRPTNGHQRAGRRLLALHRVGHHWDYAHPCGAPVRIQEDLNLICNINNPS
jgi:hypothetical protein